MKLRQSLGVSLRRMSAGAMLLAAATLLLLASSCGSDSDEESVRQPSETAYLEESLRQPGETAYLLDYVGSLTGVADPQYSLRAVDPASLSDLEGFDPIVLGKRALGAISPDGRTIALAVSKANVNNPERIFLFDLASWQMRAELGCVTDGNGCLNIHRMQWSPNGELLYFTRGGAPQRVIAMDVSTGDARASFALPFPALALFPSPDSRLLYAFGNESIDRGASVEVHAKVATLDSATGEILSSLELPEVATFVPGADGSSYSYYIPDAAISPDGTILYVAHADELWVTLVDLTTMAVSETRPLETSGGEALTVPQLIARGGVAGSRQLVISPDGARLYLTDSGENSGGPETDRLLFIDTETLDVVDVLVPSGANVAFGPLGTYTYAHRRGQLLVLEGDTPNIVGSRVVERFSRMLTFPAPDS